MIVVGFSPLKGRSPVSIWYSITANENWSAVPATGCPVTCSGDMYAGVPTTVPVRVSVVVATLATPKSVILGRPSRVIRMFAGLMSR